MTKKHWISVKRGLSEDPKHREKMGMAVWAFLHILDRADWETGLVFDWRDKDEADDMGMNERTLRDWRQRLVELGYIECRQKPRGMEIVIFNWINPRDYSAGVVNPKGDTHMSPSGGEGDTQGDTVGDTKGSSQSVTPSLHSESKVNLKGGLTEKEFQQTHDKVTAIIESGRKKTYQNRDKIPEPYLEFADTYNQLTGQEPTKRVFQDWLLTFSEWQAENLRPDHIREAYKHATRPDGGFLVARPGSLTNTAVAVKSKMRAVQNNPQGGVARILAEIGAAGG